MPRLPQSWIARENRRGCFTIGIVLALLLAALAYVGFRADPIDEGNATIPTWSLGNVRFPPIPAVSVVSAFDPLRTLAGLMGK